MFIFLKHPESFSFILMVVEMSNSGENSSILADSSPAELKENIKNQQQQQQQQVPSSSSAMFGGKANELG